MFFKKHISYPNFHTLVFSMVSLCLMIGVIALTLVPATKVIAVNKSSDTNGDGTVNSGDITLLISKWGTADTTNDINNDGIVNVLDMSILLTNWGNSSPPTGNIVYVTSFGAVGDGVTDDTTAIQSALNSLNPTDTLVFNSGKTFRHTNVLTISKDSSHLSGPGTLLATNESLSALYVKANNVTIDGNLIVKMGTTTKRWDAYEQMKIRVGINTGTIIKNITIDGSASAGIMFSGSSNYLLQDVTVQNTRSDAIHNTNGSYNGNIIRPIVRNPGDDGVAVVSYGGESICHDITIQSPKFYGQTWGRAFTVVGGNNITYNDIYAENSNAAAVYVATEGDPYYTHPSTNIKFIGGEVVNSNTNSSVDHGAVLLYNARPGYIDSGIIIDGLTITNTRSSASRQVGIIGGGSGGITQVQIKNITITGGPSSLFYSDQPGGNYTLSNWTHNGVQKY